jgi:hypothetical protein
MRFVEGNRDEVADLDMTAASKPEPSQHDACALTGQLHFAFPPLGRGNYYPGRGVTEQPVDAGPFQPRSLGGKAHIAGEGQLGQGNPHATFCNVGRGGHDSGLDQPDHALLQTPLEVEIERG